jgi:phosphate-selective porin OprO/OprP
MVDAAFHDDDARELGSGTEIRRARVFLSGRIYEKWVFKAQYGFEGNEVSVQDAFLGYAGVASTLIRIGQFKEPFSLENQTSSKYITFMERGLPDLFAPNRNIGIGFITHGENWTFAAGAFGESVGDARVGDEGFGLSGRFTLAPWHEKTRAFHLGLGGAFRIPDDASGTIRFRQRPESHLTSVRLVDTGDIDQAGHYTTLGLESAWISGPFSLQAEYMWVGVDRDRGDADVHFQGAYGYVSWFLTGESRFYSAKNGKFGRLRPKENAGDGGIGAWEVAVRYSHLDLNDGVITGGEEDNITFGLNWYINPYIRFMANYILVYTDRNAGDEEPRIFQMRAQIDF